jgi:hypothetical protein
MRLSRTYRDLGLSQDYPELPVPQLFSERSSVGIANNFYLYTTSASVATTNKETTDHTILGRVNTALTKEWGATTAETSFNAGGQVRHLTGDWKAAVETPSSRFLCLIQAVLEALNQTTRQLSGSEAMVRTLQQQEQKTTREHSTWPYNQLIPCLLYPVGRKKLKECRRDR